MRLFRGVLACSLTVLIARPPPVHSSTDSNEQSCSIVSLGHDVSFGNNAAISYSGKSLAQVFYAPDTLISGITVWRPASDQGFAAGMHLYLCGVDSTLKPQPATDVLLDGPTIVLLTAGKLPAPVRFEFDPPFALPRIGHYALAIKEEDPYCLNIIPLVTDTTMTYKQGQGWLIHAFVDCHGLGSHAAALQIDLVFQVDYCQPLVAIRTTSWGKLRSQYR